MALTDSIEARNAKAQAIADLCNAGSTNPNAKLVITDSGDNSLVEMAMGDPAFANASNGEIVANPIGEGQASGDGTATAFKVVNKDGLEVYEGSVGIDSSADLTLPTVALTFNDYVNVSDGTFIRTEQQ